MVCLLASRMWVWLLTYLVKAILDAFHMTDWLRLKVEGLVDGVDGVGDIIDESGHSSEYSVAELHLAINLCVYVIWGVHACYLFVFLSSGVFYVRV